MKHSLNTFKPAAAANTAAGSLSRPATFCNPINLPYRFALEDYQFRGKQYGREAADPYIVSRDGEYWLFLSKSGGYFHSTDLIHWDLIIPENFPVEDYAPSVTVVNGKWILMASNGCALYATDDPHTGKWEKLRDFEKMADPDLFTDDDGRVYVYWGSSPDQPIYGQELDAANNFEPIGEPTVLIAAINPTEHGWEGRNLICKTGSRIDLPPWMEGSTMLKHGGHYYLQYSAPGTEDREYADGIVVADHPLGPYTYTDYSPAVWKPGGFIGSAGHGSSFYAKDGVCWRVVTMVVGVNFDFERRIGLFPVKFISNGDGTADQYWCNTYLSDYPQLFPGTTATPGDNNLAGWMLVSLNKKCTASSVLDEVKYPASNAFDEQVETSWAAATGNPGEWIAVDLGKVCRVDALQINFADINAKLFGPLNDAYRYTVEVSDDGENWQILVDKSTNTQDAPHDYIQLDAPIMTRHLRLTAVHTPEGMVFSVSGFRVFGSGLSAKPSEVSCVKAERCEDRRMLHASWEPVENADFYIVRYGVKADRLNLHWQVYNCTEMTVFGLNTDSEYFVAVDAVNDSGYTLGTQVVPAK